MNSKNLWIKKYSYLRDETPGDLYLVIDLKRMSEGHRLIVHEITVDFDGLRDIGYGHRARRYDVEKHMDFGIPPERIARSVFERHESAFRQGQRPEGNEHENGSSKPAELKESGMGPAALLDLQYTESYPELKVQILKEPRSDTFGKLLSGMAHLPLRATERDETDAGKGDNGSAKKKSSKKSGSGSKSGKKSKKSEAAA